MELSNFVLSYILACSILIPLSIKWQIKTRQSFIGILWVGGLSGLMVGAIPGTSEWHLSVVGLLGSFFIILIAAMSAAFFFYRDPERKPPDDGSFIVSPADGTVIYVKQLANEGDLVSTKGKNEINIGEIKSVVPNQGFLIGIGMNLLNVHVNRAPIGGKVETLRQIRGSFLSLKRSEALQTNERFVTIIETGRFKIGVVQIASRLVRRIVSYLEVGEEVCIGSRIGMIKFGSQVDVVVPRIDGLNILVEPGSKVLAGVSVIAEYGGPEETREAP